MTAPPEAEASSWRQILHRTPEARAERLGGKGSAPVADSV
jgi:hypothetical protein